MDKVGGQLEPRNMVLILHYDGFAPFAMAENHSVGYLLVQVETAVAQHVNFSMARERLRED